MNTRRLLQNLLNNKSLFLGALVVIPIWTLIAIPGVSVGGGGTIGLSVEYMQHGWPFAHSTSASVRYCGDWRNGVFVKGAKPQTVDFDEVANSKLNESEHLDSLYLDWRFLPSNRKWESDSLQESNVWNPCFWSNRSKWPILNDADGWVTKLNLLGLVLNLLVLICLTLVAASAIAFKRKHNGRLFKFSLFQAFFFFGCISLIFSLLAREFYRAKHESAVLKMIISPIETSDCCHVSGNRKNSLPVIVSQLIDHRCILPFTDLQLFRPVTDARIRLDDKFMLPQDAQQKEDFIQAINQARFPIAIIVNQYNSETEELLNRIGSWSRVNDLTIRFDFELEWDENDRIDDNIEINLNANFSAIQSLTLELDTDIKQQKLLQPFLNLNSLEKLEILGVNETGANYLISVRDQLPSGTSADLSNPIGMSESLVRQFRKKYTPIADPK